MFMALLREHKETQHVWDKLLKNMTVNGTENGYAKLEPFLYKKSYDCEAQITIAQFHQFLLDTQKQTGSDGKPITLEECKERLSKAIKTQGRSQLEFEVCQ